MAETTLDLRDLPKVEAYDQLHTHVGSVLAGVDDEIAAMATMSSLMHHAFGHLWTGFYRVVEPNRLLRVGPYQGALGCIEITFGQGVCGTAAAERRTVVVPVFGADGALRAVLDVDSEHQAAFDDVDACALERLVGWFQGER